jgi:hypothetical protein
MTKSNESPLPYANDGWQARLHESTAHKTFRVHLTLRWQGRTLVEQDVAVNLPSYGEATRSLLLWEAIAEYLNSGGDPYTLPSMFSAASRLSSFTLPDYELLVTEVRDGYRIHTFSRRDDPSRILSWQEGVICEELTATQLGEYLTALDELDDREDLLDSESAGPPGEDLRELSREIEPGAGDADGGP